MPVLLEIKNLYVKYKGTQKVAIENLSFFMPEGKVSAILGPSGCGKTTLLNAISNLISPQEAEIRGEIKFKKDGQSVSAGMVFQSPMLLPWRKLFQNIAYGVEIKKIPKAEIEKRVNKAIEIVGLKGFENYYPHQLSLGMCQRANFARALACEPDLLLLDEPFSSLDPKTKKKIQEEFLSILKSQQITSIFVTHSIEEAFYMADRIIVLSKGPARIKQFFENRESFYQNHQNIVNAYE